MTVIGSWVATVCTMVPVTRGLINVLFDRLSVVAWPTRVSVDVGNVNVPVFTMVLNCGEVIIGDVSVLLVRVCVATSRTNVPAASGNV